MPIQSKVKLGACSSVVTKCANDTHFANSNHCSCIADKSVVDRACVGTIYLLLKGFLAAVLLFFKLSFALGTPYGERMGFALAYAQLDVVEQLESISSLNCGWVRFGIDWCKVEPSIPAPSHVYQWVSPSVEYLDDLVSLAQNGGLNVIITLGGAPCWARPSDFRPQNEADCCNWQDAAHNAAPAAINGADWGLFCAEVAARYSARGVHHYEIINEPNSQYFYTTNSESLSYLNTLRIAADAIRNADPDAVIILGSLKPVPYTHGIDFGHEVAAVDWLTSIYSHSYPDDYVPERSIPASHFFDVVGYHPYSKLCWQVLPDCNHVPFPPYGSPLYDYDGDPAFPHDRYSTFLHTLELYNVMVAHGDPLTQIWGTEVGLNTWIDSATPVQAAWVNDYMKQWFEWPFTGPLLWYLYQDAPGQAWGIFDTTWNKKPSYDEIRNWSTGKVEYHIGDSTGEFAYHEWNVDLNQDGTNDLVDRIMSAAAICDTLRVFFHETNQPYDLSTLSLLDFTQIPETSPFRCLELVGCGPNRDDVTGHFIVEGMDGSIKLKSNQALRLRNLTFQNCSASQHSLIVTTGNVEIENCHFIANEYPQGILGWGNAELGEIGIQTPQVVQVDKSVFSSNTPGGGTGERALLNCVNGIVLDRCTFYENAYAMGDISLRQGFSMVSNSIFRSSASGTGVAIANQYANLTVQYCAFNQEDWAQGFLSTVTAVGNVVVDHEQTASKLAFVDPAAGDFRLRWDNVAQDNADPGLPLDFDLTRADIGWQAEYDEQDLSGDVTTSLAAGHYNVVDHTTIHVPLEAGVVLRMASGKTLFLWPGSASVFPVGDLAGPRTAIVARPASQSQSARLIEFFCGLSETFSYELNGVLFNYPPISGGSSFLYFTGYYASVQLDGRQVQFQNWINVSVGDGTSARVDGGLLFEGMTGRVSHLSVGNAAERGPGTLILSNSDMDVQHCTFRATGTNDNSDLPPLLVLSTYGGGTPQLTYNTFQGTPDQDGPLADLLHTVVRLEHNRFLNCQNTALIETHSALNLSHEARNDFMASPESFQQESPLLALEGGDLDLYCGRNNFVVRDYRPGWPVISWSPYPGDVPSPQIWRQNYWGTNCSLPIPESVLNDSVMGLLPSWATAEGSLLHCVEPDMPENPACPFEPYTALELLTLGNEAADVANHALARDYFRFLLLLHPGTKEANEGTLRLKGLGLNKDYGPDAYGLVAGDLFAAADSSEAVPLHLQAVLQDCSGWCVEAYWGDREGAKVALTALLAVETDKVCQDTINRALLEIDTYPSQGGLSSASPLAQVQRRLAKQEAVHALVSYPRGTSIRPTEAPAQPERFELLRPYPNPFNPTTTLVVAVPEPGQVSVRIYNLAGQQVAEALNRQVPAGLHHLRVDGSAWASGVYVAVAECAGHSQTHKLLLLK